ncbi:2-polyprenyl-6-methoxyphenol hydroxylase-like oxidoreductase [Burkholderiales bacterium JOSHI_001]|nr:2-polyprenyl-6-methoxyphenol hydroxylase-like oxidoreductase [Burkholderiales bacterium JOSHI_001]
MHQPQAQPRASIYYRYQVFPAAPRPAPGADALGGAAVVVVGAGPIGLTIALDLARHGVRVVLLAAERQVSEGSRAIVFTRRSMEILQQVGVADAMLARGLPWRFGNSFYRGQCIFRLQAPQDENDRFGPLLNLQQQVLEEALVNAVAGQPLIELRWGHKLTGLVSDDSGATLSVDTEQGEYTLRTPWLVAADGARSFVRQALDLRMEGDAYEGRFVIADIRVDLPYPTERRAYFDPDWNPGNTVLMHKEPEGIWRIDYQLPAGETPEQALAPAALKARIDAQLAMIGHAGVPWELDWCSVYSARAMTLPGYVHGRVLFTGDAAHLLPIFGVRGANTGFQDAHNLGWKLAAVVKGLAPAALLHSYSHERVGAAREIIQEAGKSTRFMTPPSAGFRLLRDATLQLALRHDFVRPLLHWRTSRAHDYLDSPLNSADDSGLPGPRPGAPMPDVQLAPGQHLMDATGPAFHLLLAGDAARADLAPAIARWRQRGVALVLWSAGPQAAPGAAAHWPDASGRLRQRYGLQATAAGAWLIRPDQHLAARFAGPAGSAPGAHWLDAALARALALQTVEAA